MSIEDIKKTIQHLTNSVTEDNAQSIASSLNDLNQFIQVQFSNSPLAKEISQFSGKTKDKIKALEKSNQVTAKLIVDNESLKKLKGEVEAKHARLKEELDKLDTLKKQGEELRDFSRVQNEVSKISDENDALIKLHIETLTKLNQVMGVANSDLGRQLASKAQEAQQNLAAVLVSLDTTQFKIEFSELEKSVNELVTDYNYHVQKIITVKKDLEIITKEYDTVISIFSLHHLENENIFGALQNREGVLQHVQTISNEISERLKLYDLEIKTLVDKRDQLPICELAEAKKYQ